MLVSVLSLLVTKLNQVNVVPVFKEFISCGRERCLINKIFSCADVSNEGTQLVDVTGRDRHGAALDI